MANAELVPEGHATIAQRFNVGLISAQMIKSRRDGRNGDRMPQPSLRDWTAICLVLPDVETLGYCRPSLRDDDQILVALEPDPCAPGLHCAVQPPSMVIVCPVTLRASGLMRYWI